MKIRRSSACFGTCMSGSLQAVEASREAVAEPDGGKPCSDGDCDVEPCGGGMVCLPQAQSFQAEHGEGSIAAAEPGHDELPMPRPGEDAAVRSRQGRVEANDERPRDIDEQRGPGKFVSRCRRESERCQRPQQGADY